MKKIEDAIAYGAKAAALREEINAADDHTEETEHLSMVAELYGLISEANLAEAVDEEE